MIRVLVADDHPIVRRGLAQILEEVSDITPAGEAGTGREVLHALRQNDYDVVVLDISMPESDGLQVLRQLHSLRPDLPILIFTIHAEKQFAVHALRAGAAGYLTKDCDPDDLIAAIRQVARGEKYITASLAVALANQLGDGRGAPHATLSDREFQVMRLLASGKTVTDIAKELSLSVKTVSTYRARILEKLLLENTADIIRYAIEHGLVER